MRLVWAASALFFVLISVLAVDRYVTYHYGADLGLFTQTIASAFHGFSNQVEHGSHFMVHFSPIYFACAPFLAVFHSPMTLQVLQAFACALTAPPIYLFARKRVDDRLAVFIAIVALLYPPLVGMSLSEFHENAFAPATIAWLLWAVDERRWGWAALCAAIALSIKEDQAIILAIIGSGYALYSLRRHDRNAAIFGGSVAAAGIIVLIAYFAFIQPHAGGRWFIIDLYSNNAEFERTHGHDFARGIVAITGRLTFLLEVLVPLAFVPLASRWMWLAVPGLVEVLSSRWPVTYTGGTHYAGVWIPYVLFAFAEALGRIAPANPQRAVVFTRASLVLCLLNLIVASPTHWAHFYRLRTAHDAALDRIIATVPIGADVGSFDEAYTHMSLDPNARIGMYVTPDYFVYDAQFVGATWQTSIVPRLAAVVCAGYFAPVASEDGVTLFKRIRAVPDAVYERAQRSPPHCAL